MRLFRRSESCHCKRISLESFILHGIARSQTDRVATPRVISVDCKKSSQTWICYRSLGRRRRFVPSPGLHPSSSISPKPYHDIRPESGTNRCMLQITQESCRKNKRQSIFNHRRLRKFGELLRLAPHGRQRECQSQKR